VAGAIPVVGGVGQRVIEARGAAALYRLTRTRALDRGGVDQQQIVEEPWAVACEVRDQRLDLAADAQPALVERLTCGEVREQVRRRCRATAKNRSSDGSPMIAWARHRVMSSASVIRRRAFPARLGRKSSVMQ
jgi:hypothetical protein